jgi:hypothetical protein
LAKRLEFLHRFNESQRQARMPEFMIAVRIAERNVNSGDVSLVSSAIWIQLVSYIDSTYVMVGARQ